MTAGAVTYHRKKKKGIDLETVFVTCLMAAAAAVVFAVILCAIAILRKAWDKEEQA